MNKQDIIKRLTNTQLDIHERESLCQLLHYLNAEGVNNTSSNNNNTRSHKRSSTIVVTTKVRTLNTLVVVTHAKTRVRVELLTAWRVFCKQSDPYTQRPRCYACV